MNNKYYDIETIVLLLFCEVYVLCGGLCGAQSCWGFAGYKNWFPRKFSRHKMFELSFICFLCTIGLYINMIDINKKKKENKKYKHIEKI